uniref:Nesprin-2-like n=1 Tax=Poecilia formosa TaxID=48698 RepID=A0A096MAX4_POEFO
MSGPNPSSQHHSDPLCCSDNNAGPGDESLESEPLLDLNQQPVLCSWTSQGDSSWSQDGEQPRYGQLDRKWVLWHEFMQEHTHLDAWLRLAEQAINSLSPAHLTYSASKEELRKFQRLRREAGSQLIRLDGLTRRNRILPRLFQGAVQVRLLGAARECGRRWDEVDAKLETITGRLQLCVSEWEEFEAEREELALWLADMDARLTEIDHMTGSNCEKLRELQSFQQVLCENSGRVNDLLRRGEELIQRREPADARRVESYLLELLRRCSHVYDNIARTHTRLLSTMLVFEGDTVLTRPADSGYPSESVLQQSMNAAPTGLAHRPPTPPPSPTHEHLGLEWDPSVDIGRSLSHDDADSSYFSVCTESKSVRHQTFSKKRSRLLMPTGMHGGG